MRHGRCSAMAGRRGSVPAREGHLGRHLGPETARGGTVASQRLLTGIANLEGGLQAARWADRLSSLDPQLPVCSAKCPGAGQSRRWRSFPGDPTDALLDKYSNFKSSLPWLGYGALLVPSCWPLAALRPFEAGMAREAAAAEPGSELEGPLERWQVRRRDEDFDRPRLARHTANEAAPFEPLEHRVHRRRREVEEALQVGMARRNTSPIGCNVLADVGQELPLLTRWSAGGCRGVGAIDAVCGVELVQRCVHGINSELHRVARLERGLVDDDPVIEHDLKPGHALAQQFLRFGRGVSTPTGLRIGVRGRGADRTHGAEFDASIDACFEFCPSIAVFRIGLAIAKTVAEQARGSGLAPGAGTVCARAPYRAG
jgi:hypothetical protein